MAVYAAHLTRTLQGTPSVFQVAAQEALGGTVKPALQKLVEYVAAVYPNKCGWCERWYDELYLLLDYCLQYHYLKHYAASFSECFYGLFRVPISPSTEFNSGPRLPQNLERGSLALLVLLPYVQQKVEKMVDKWRQDIEDGRLGKSKTDRARKAAVRLWSVVHSVSAAGRLAVLARYVSGAGRSPSPALQLLGLALRDAPADPPADTWGDCFRALRAGRLGSAVVTFPMVWRACSAAAQHGAFAVQLLRWWDAHRPLALHHLPAPPPPQRADAPAPNVCPVCRQRWRVPTVLPVSGLVFCYSCVSRSLRATGACPATRAPAALADLRRLYLDDVSRR